MQIVINGQKMELSSPVTVQGLLELLGYQKASVAVALNSNCVPRQQFVDCVIEDRDEVEILAPMAGG